MNANALVTILLVFAAALTYVGYNRRRPILVLLRNPDGGSSCGMAETAQC